MRQEDWRALALVLAGSFTGLIAIFVPSQPLNPVAIATLMAITLFLLTYGVGLPQHYYHVAILGCRRSQPFRIGILNDMEWDPANTEICVWTDVGPEDWKTALEGSAQQAGVKVRVEFIKVSKNFDSYTSILNPYGGVYPELDLKELTTLNKIVNYVKEGGIFVNVADIPSYWAYNPILHRRIGITPTVYIGFQAGNTVGMISQKPFDLTPLVKELAVRGLNVDQGMPQSLNNVIPHTNLAPTFRRTAVVESNIESSVDTTKLRYPDGSIRDTSPLFFVRYGEGDFLISMIWITDQNHNQQMKDLVKKVISTLTVERVRDRFGK